MFSKLIEYPTDPILGLSEQFADDSRDSKVNLTVGVYCDDDGKLPIFDSVQGVESQLLESKSSKKYLPICGTKKYQNELKKLVFGPDDENVAVSYSLGGTGAVRMGAELIAALPGFRSVWTSSPTWGNHWSILEEAGVNYHHYPYRAKNSILDVDVMLGNIELAKPGDLVLLHGCCHNPTGIDPTQEQWGQIFDAMAKKGLIPFFDIAYQGFNKSFDDDIWSVREACKLFPTILVAYSFSKVLGLYGERSGGILVKTDSPSTSLLVQSNLARIARCMHSNPPVHGAKVVESILGDPEARKSWISELDTYRNRINTIRKQFGNKLLENGIEFNDIEKQKGLFSILPITIEQARDLRAQHGVYVLDSGRINVAGINNNNIDYLVSAFKNVLCRR